MKNSETILPFSCCPLVFTQSPGRNLLPKLCGEVRPETVPLCCAPCSTEGRKRRKGAEKKGGRRGGAKSKKGRVKTGQSSPPLKNPSRGGGCVNERGEGYKIPAGGASKHTAPLPSPLKCLLAKNGVRGGGDIISSWNKLSHTPLSTRVVADVWEEKDVWEFQAKSGSSGSCGLSLHFLGKIAVREMSGKAPGSPRHPSSRHPRTSDRCSFPPPES